VYRFLKRPLDIVLSIVGLIILLPIYAILAGLVLCLMGRPIIFRQQRPGLHGKIFSIYKFRTMLNTGDETGRLLPDSERLTRFGIFLRRTSLDELPELFNVLRGEMSLVGPRPLLVQYLQRYTPEQARRHEVRPGITGWAQVNGRNAITWEEKFSLDVWYVDHLSFMLDIRILLLTILTVLRREGINQQDHATMQEFKNVGKT
jgi:sugar transferase EpsL